MQQTLVLTLVLQTWFNFVQGPFWLTALAIGLTIVATATFVVGCRTLLGIPGIAVGSILTLFVANPLASSAAPWQFLPEPWGIIGQYFVPGASTSLVRSLSYFPDAGTATQWSVLVAWAALGLALMLVGHRRAPALAGGGDKLNEAKPS